MLFSLLRRWVWRSYHPLLGGLRSTKRMKIVVVVNDTTKDISKLVSILFFYFVMFLPVFRKSLLEKRYDDRCIKCVLRSHGYSHNLRLVMFIRGGN